MSTAWKIRYINRNYTLNTEDQQSTKNCLKRIEVLTKPTMLKVSSEKHPKPIQIYFGCGLEFIFGTCLPVPLIFLWINLCVKSWVSRGCGEQCWKMNKVEICKAVGRSNLKSPSTSIHMNDFLCHTINGTNLEHRKSSSLLSFHLPAGLEEKVRKQQASPSSQDEKKSKLSVRLLRGGIMKCNLSAVRAVARQEWCGESSRKFTTCTRTLIYSRCPKFPLWMFFYQLTFTFYLFIPFGSLSVGFCWRKSNCPFTSQFKWTHLKPFATHVGVGCRMREDRWPLAPFLHVDRQECVMNENEWKWQVVVMVACVIERNWEIQPHRVTLSWVISQCPELGIIINIEYIGSKDQQVHGNQFIRARQLEIILQARLAARQISISRQDWPCRDFQSGFQAFRDV